MLTGTVIGRMIKKTKLKPKKNTQVFQVYKPENDILFFTVIDLTREFWFFFHVFQSSPGKLRVYPGTVVFYLRTRYAVALPVRENIFISTHVRRPQSGFANMGVLGTTTRYNPVAHNPESQTWTLGLPASIRAKFYCSTIPVP